ncbi:MAG: hypothetical protein MK234_07055, partial [Nitrospinales bacterium]|nr:hypothetical protein [Nitrospinales bacterium]
MLLLRFLKHSTVFVFCFFLVFFLLEIFIRIFIPQSIVPSYRASAFDITNALKANYNAEAVYGGITYQIQTNEKHLRRAKNLPYEKPENTFRILCLGDSILFGFGANNEETFTYYLEKILNKKFRGTTFEVINAAAPGWGLLEYYLFLKNEGYKYSPDLIITTTFIDDLSHLPDTRIEFKGLRHERTSNNEVKIFLDEWNIRSNESSLYRRLLQTLQQSALYESLTRSSHLLNLIRYRLSQLWAKDKLIQKKTPGSLEYFVKNIGLKKVDNIVWVIPELQTSNLNATAKAIQYHRTPESLNATAKAIQYRLLMDKVSKLTGQMKVKVLSINLPTYQEVLGLVKSLDLNFSPGSMKFNSLRFLSRFQNKHLIPLYFPMSNHWTPAGHNFVAHLIFNFMVENQMISQLKTVNDTIDVTNSKITERIRQSNLRIDDKLQASPKMLFNLAIIYKNRGQLTLAKENIIRYLQKFTNDSEAYNMLGIIDYKMGDILLAEENTKKAIKINPNNHWFHLRL